MLALKPAGEPHTTTNKDVARALAREIRRQIEANGRIDRAAEAADLDALIEQFEAVNGVESSRAQTKDNAQRVRRLRDELGIKHPAEITLERIQEWS